MLAWGTIAVQTRTGEKYRCSTIQGIGGREREGKAGVSRFNRWPSLHVDLRRGRGKGFH